MQRAARENHSNIKELVRKLVPEYRVYEEQKKQGSMENISIISKSLHYTKKEEKSIMMAYVDLFRKLL